MHFFQQLKTIPLFVRYYLSRIDQHSLQSPYIYDFYSKLTEHIKQNDGLAEVEARRSLFLKDKSIVNGLDLGAGTRFINTSKKRTISMLARHGISSKKDCIFLFELLRLFQPKTSIELGTSLGIATAYLAKSIFKGEVYSFEGNEALVERARQMLGELDCKNVHIIQGNIDVELPEFLNQVDRFDFAFIDANHTERALLAYFNMLKVKIAQGGIMVVDDIRWSKEMYGAWKKLLTDEQVTISIEFLNKGLLIFNLGMLRQHYVLSF